MRFVGLLRGINVGTSVKVPMKTLKERLEALGLTSVVTYLNSGNVVFTGDPGKNWADVLEADLEHQFGQKIPVLVKSADEVVRIEQAIPANWANDETQQTYVAYLFPDFDRPELIAELPIKHQFLTIHYVPGALVWNIQRENYNRSQITKLVAHPSYARMTTRNVNTARKLAQLVLE